MALPSEQWHQCCGWLCCLLSSGLHGSKAGCIHWGSGRIRYCKILWNLVKL